MKTIMNTIIEMAHEAGAVSYSPPPMRAVRGVSFTYEQLDAFAKLVRADEFEKCAKLCDARVMGDNNREDMEAKRCAADIRSFRARANK